MSVAFAIAATTAAAAKTTLNVDSSALCMTSLGEQIVLFFICFPLYLVVSFHFAPFSAHSKFAYVTQLVYHNSNNNNSKKKVHTNTR